jgi:hypothetical protein
MLDDIKKELGKYIEITKDLEYEKMPDFLTKSLDEFLVPLNEGTPKSSLNLVLLTKCAQML